jgi:hypothetical protein
VNRGVKAPLKINEDQQSHGEDERGDSTPDRERFREPNAAAQIEGHRGTYPSDEISAMFVTRIFAAAFTTVCTKTNCLAV